MRIDVLGLGRGEAQCLVFWMMLPSHDLDSGDLKQGASVCSLDLQIPYKNRLDEDGNCLLLYQKK